MRNALHEQLLKAGLIDEQRLHDMERDKDRGQKAPSGRGPKPKHHRQQRNGATEPPPAPTARSTPPPVRAPQRAPDEHAARRAVERELVQIIKAGRHPHNDGDEVYNFVDGKKVGRIYVTPATHAAIARGELVIVRLRTRYAVVNQTTAAEVAIRAPGSIVLANAASAPGGNDPAYAEHPIPDDLRW
ncbi:MAG: DUF2058 domain-containing protein [Gammaproteobacteria bacterium]|nr:DUF2058 domain-containing protein [Gammaproteobacteria bacterium]